MIDNFKQIRELLKFNDPNDYYFIEVLKRRKDNPRLLVNSRFIKDYYIFSIEDFDNAKDEILCTCEVYHARAYIRLNIRNSYKTAIYSLQKLADCIASNNTRASIRLCRKSSSEQHADSNPTYLVDIDNLVDLNFAKSIITDLHNTVHGMVDHGILAEIQTPNGVHLITKPFEIEKFIASCPTVPVFKDAPTVLYSPILTS
jgi:hypothetical protein